MKRLFSALLILSFIIAFASCAASNKSEANDFVTPTETPYSDTEHSALPAQADNTTECDDVQDSDNVEQTSYTGALSDEQKSELLKYTEEWYKENFSEYEVLSIEIAEDDDERAQQGYGYYPDMKPGEIIILLVHTTHGSKIKDGKTEGIPRTCFVKITDDGFEVINEGY